MSGLYRPRCLASRPPRPRRQCGLSAAAIPSPVHRPCPCPHQLRGARQCAARRPPSRPPPHRALNRGPFTMATLLTPSPAAAATSAESICPCLDRRGGEVHLPEPPRGGGRDHGERVLFSCVCLGGRRRSAVPVGRRASRVRGGRLWEGVSGTLNEKWCGATFSPSIPSRGASAMKRVQFTQAEREAFQVRHYATIATDEQPVARPPAAGACPRSAPPALFLVLVMF
jgi:hypothetical protein